MYTWLLRYIDMFGKDFPVSAVKDRTEYEIVRMIQECCKSGKEYVVETGSEDDAGSDEGTGAAAGGDA